MNKQTISFTASEQTLTLVGDLQTFASNTVSYIDAQFTLSNNWTGYDSVRAVWRSNDYTISTILNSSGKCTVPAEVLYYKSNVFVNLVGTTTANDEVTERLTTEPIMALQVTTDAEINSTETADITPSQFDQFVEQVSDDAASAAASAAAAAQSAASLTVDPALSPSSTNPVQNKVITNEIFDLKEDFEYVENVVYDSDGYIKLPTPTAYTSGNMYSGSVGNAISSVSASSSLAYNAIDLTDYVGATVTVKFDTTATSSSRLTALCDTNGIIGTLYYEKAMSSDGFVFTVTSTYKYLYISIHQYLTSNIVITAYDPSAKLPALASEVDSISDDIQRKFVLEPDLFELGNISMTNSGWTYNDTAARIRTKEGTTIHLTKDTVIGLTSYSAKKYYVGWLDEDGNYGYADSLTSDYTTTVTGEYVFVLHDVPQDTITDISTLTSLIFGYANTTGYSVAKNSSFIEGMKTIPFALYDGYINSTGGIQNPNSTRLEKYTEKIPVQAGERILVNASYSIAIEILWIAYAMYDANGTFISRNTLYEVGNIKNITKSLVVPSGTYYISFTYRSYGETPLTVYADDPAYILKMYQQRFVEDIAYVKGLANKNVRSINHRGYNTIAPENTLPAFKLSRRKGFDTVETDVRFTSDGIAVCLHDASINRTARDSDGNELGSTINISSISYADALAYDFGIWMGSDYAGTPIPTLEEFFTLCHNIGLDAYVELKGTMTQANVTSLISLANECGMNGHVTWTCADDSVLQYVNTADSIARIGYVVNSVDATIITEAQALGNGTNDVFIDSGSYTSSEIALCVAASIPLEAWTVDNYSDITALDPYITGVTSDRFVAGYELYMYGIN